MTCLPELWSSRSIQRNTNDIEQGEPSDHDPIPPLAPVHLSHGGRTSPDYDITLPEAPPALQRGSDSSTTLSTSSQVWVAIKLVVLPIWNWLRHSGPQLEHGAQQRPLDKDKRRNWAYICLRDKIGDYALTISFEWPGRATVVKRRVDDPENPGRRYQSMYLRDPEEKNPEEVFEKIREALYREYGWWKQYVPGLSIFAEEVTVS